MFPRLFCRSHKHTWRKRLQGRRRPRRRPEDSRHEEGRRCARAKKFVYFFGNGKADGNRYMKDTLGGKGSGLAEMTNAGLPVPPGFTISTDACNLYYEQRRQAPARDRRRDRGAPEAAREGRRRHARLDREPAAGLGPLGREVLDARHDGHHPQPRPQRRRGRGPEGPHRQRPLRVRQLPPLHADVRLRRPRDSEGRVRARVRGGEDGQGRRSSTPTSTRPRCARWSSAYKAVVKKKTRQAVPAGPERPAGDGAQRRVPLVEQPARQGIPPHLRHPGLDRHRRQRADDGVRQHRRPLGHRRRLHAQPGHRRQGVLRRVPDQRPGRGRGRRHPHAAADQRARTR